MLGNLIYDTHVTGSIVYNANPGDVRTAREELSVIGAGNCHVVEHIGGYASHGGP